MAHLQPCLFDCNMRDVTFWRRNVDASSNAWKGSFLNRRLWIAFGGARYPGHNGVGVRCLA
jgi:hypothetical protein